MRGSTTTCLAAFILTVWSLLAAPALRAQAIQTEGDIAATGAVLAGGDLVAEGQIVSNAPPGTEPLVVGSSTMVRGLNADRIDGLHGSDLALETDLQNAEAMLLALQGQMDALGVARPRRTGQSSCYNQNGTVVSCTSVVGQGQDGQAQKGVDWPNPRFTDNGDGTVTDNLTSLVWLRDATCASSRQDWVEALEFARTLYDGSTGHNGGDCALEDGSIAGEWRVPNPVELQTLVHFGFSDPAIPDTAGVGRWEEGDPFVDVRTDFYWTSASFPYLESQAYLMYTFDGSLRVASKPGSWRVWPVRDH